MLTELLTIGAYGWEEAAFFRALAERGVDTFCDIRARRGVRGSAYAFANSQRLQAGLVALGIAYLHRRDLAPSQDTRDQQHAADQAAHVPRRQRAELSPEFRRLYQRERLADFDSAAFAAGLGPQASKVVLFCVERTPEACHRSLLSERLSKDLDLKVTHLVP